MSLLAKDYVTVGVASSTSPVSWKKMKKLAFFFWGASFHIFFQVQISRHGAAVDGRNALGDPDATNVCCHMTARFT